MTPMVPQTAPSSLHQQTTQKDRRLSLKSGAGAATSTGFAEGEILYEKCALLPSPSPGVATGSLKQLFRFGDVQAP